MKKKSNISFAKEIIKREISALNRTVNKIDSRFDDACKVLSNITGKVVTMSNTQIMKIRGEAIYF